MHQDIVFFFFYDFPGGENMFLQQVSWSSRNPSTVSGGGRSLMIMCHKTPEIYRHNLLVKYFHSNFTSLDVMEIVKYHTFTQFNMNIGSPRHKFTLPNVPTFVKILEPLE